MSVILVTFPPGAAHGRPPIENTVQRSDAESPSATHTTLQQVKDHPDFSGRRTLDAGNAPPHPTERNEALLRTRYASDLELSVKADETVEAEHGHVPGVGDPGR